MSEFFSDVFSGVLAGIGVTDIIDVVLVIFVAYKVLGFIQETRAAQLIVGLVILLAAAYLSGKFNLYTLNWILKGTLTFGVIALIIIFQPELRRALTQLGQARFLRLKGQVEKNDAKRIASVIARSVDYFSANRVGALIVMERQTILNDHAESGTPLDCLISEEVLGTIFWEGTPLHDGAVIVRGKRIAAAGCILPLTQSRSLERDLGTRHRAAIGITENSDALAVVVSEETGIISLAADGQISRFLDIKSVEKTILELYISPRDRGRWNFVSWFRRREEDGNE